MKISVPRASGDEPSWLESLTAWQKCSLRERG